MELAATGSPRAWALLRRVPWRVDLPAVAAWTSAFSLVAYLALRDGGYDTVARGEIGIAVWWIVLLGSVAGVLPTRIGRAGWAAVALLGAFAVWTGLAIGWSESQERSGIELARLATYLGVLVLMIAIQGRTAARHTINGVACAIGGITALAVLSRLHPQWFPANDHFTWLGPASGRKLSYPLNYWNALAAFAAIGVPLLLALALNARTLAGQAAAAAGLPMCALCVYLTMSRGGALAVAVGLGAFLILAPRRLDALATLAVSAAGAALLLAATGQRPALVGGLPTPAAQHQGSQMLWIAVIVCGGVALLQVALGLGARHLDRPSFLVPDRRTTTLRAATMLAVVALIGIGAGVPGELEARWGDFKAPLGVVAAGSDATLFSRLQAANGNGRYQFWQAAVNADATDPWKGIGPGTFEFWWAQHATTDGFIRNAHSLYLETFAETGIIGLALLGGLLLWLCGVAVARSLRARAELRIWIAAAAGGLVAFLTSAALEWVWQMATIAVAVLALGAVILAGREDAPAGEREQPSRSRRVPRAIVAGLAVAALGAVLMPLAGTVAIRDSRAAAAAGRLRTALQDSLTAERLQPYAATPRLQRALVLEAAGALGPAAAAARASTAGEPTNWRTWLVLARIDARRGAALQAVGELRQARSLNPRSTLLRQP